MPVGVTVGAGTGVKAQARHTACKKEAAGVEKKRVERAAPPSDHTGKKTYSGDCWSYVASLRRRRSIIRLGGAHGQQVDTTSCKIGVTSSPDIQGGEKGARIGREETKAYPSLIMVEHYSFHAASVHVNVA